jgi:hypothetical protein
VLERVIDVTRMSAIAGIGAVLLVLGACAVPWTSANPVVKQELNNPDEVYLDVEGQTYEDNKTGEPERGGNDTYSVTVSVLRKGSERAVTDSVTFPYQKYNWSITSWYRSPYGLRFYDVSYRGEKLLYDHQLPWVRVDGMQYDLTYDMRVDGPDLYIYSLSRVFKVWVKYSIPSIDTDIEVYCYFSESGEMDPWAIVDCNCMDRDIIVPERFDFDLGGSDDDNAQAYTLHWWGNTWDLVEEEGTIRDAGQPEAQGIQWRLLDTDAQGVGYVTDQLVDIKPYHTDAPYMTFLRYHYGEVVDLPGTYDNDEVTGQDVGGSGDPFVGCDLVVWYVSTYEDTDWCNPGPWMFMTV